MHGRTFTNHRSVPALALCTLLLAACSDDDPAVDEDALCPGESGVGIRVEGRAETLDVCVSDAAVDALLTSESHYDVTARLTLDDDSVVQLRLVFTQRPDAPVNLRLVDSITEATNDPGTVYVSYQEVPGTGSPIQSTAITGGTFRLTFNDDKVAAGTMEDVGLNMSSVQTGDPAGTRQIVEGFFSVSVSPAAVTAGVR
jgi:hypothetical protein